MGKTDKFKQLFACSCTLLFFAVFCIDSREQFKSQDSSLSLRYTFKRLRWLKNKTLSYIATFVFVILWHGFWPGYFINFTLEFFDIIASQTVRACVCMTLFEQGSPRNTMCVCSILDTRFIRLMGTCIANLCSRCHDVCKGGFLRNTH